MVSRRLIRIKAYQVLFAYYKSDSDNIENAKKEVLFSINKTYELYHKVLLLLVEIKEKLENKLEKGKVKKLPTLEDLNPNTKFINNKLINQLENTEIFTSYVERHKISWKNNPEFITKLVKNIEDSDYYKKYMNTDNDFVADKKVILSILEDTLLDCNDFYELLENDSIYWNDEIELVIDMILQTFKKLKETSTKIAILPLYKSETDKKYAVDLVSKTILDHNENTKIIFEYVKNWDSERLAFTDSLLMEMAFIELVHFNEIPVKVTLNEYIEIAKFYSTKQSGQFINGVLDKMIKKLTKENLIKKTGLGLKGSI